MFGVNALMAASYSKVADGTIVLDALLKEGKIGVDTGAQWNDHNTLIKACKIGEIYTQFGEYAVVNDCEDCDDMEVKNLLKY